MASQRHAAAARRPSRAQGKQVLWLVYEGKDPSRLFAAPSVENQVQGEKGRGGDRWDRPVLVDFPDYWL